MLAYHESLIAGCVRVYPLRESSTSCLTELLVGAGQFTRMLDSLGKNRKHVIEIGRWVVDPAFGNRHSLAPGIGIQLAAGAGALAVALSNQMEFGKGVAIFAAGTRDSQYLTLAHLGMKEISGLAPVRSIEYDDLVQVLYCDTAIALQPRFRRVIESLSMAIRIEEIVSSVHNGALQGASKSN